MRYVLFVLAFLPLFFGVAYGDSISELDSTSTYYSSYNSFAQVDSDTIVLSHAGGGQTGYITTYDVDEDGTLTQIAEIHHFTTSMQYGHLYKLNSGIFALALGGDVGAQGFIKTFDISNDGTSIIELDNYNFSTYAGHSYLTQIDSGIVVVAYRAEGHQDGFIKTFDIPANGIVTELNSFQYDSNKPQFNRLIQLDSDTIVLNYYSEQPTQTGFIKTYDISTSGIITEKDLLNYGESVHFQSLVKVDSNTVTISFTDLSGSGQIKTFDIDSDGTGITEINSFEFAEYGEVAQMTKLAPNSYALVYRDNFSDGNIKTFDITNSGNISELTHLLHETSSFGQPTITKVNSNTAAVMYSHSASPQSSFVKTFGTLPIVEDTGDLEEIQAQLNSISSQISSLTDLVSQNIADITNLQTQVDDLSTQGDIEDPLLPPEIMTLYSTNGTNFLYNANGTSNLYMCTPIE